MSCLEYALSPCTYSWGLADSAIGVACLNDPHSTCQQKLVNTTIMNSQGAKTPATCGDYMKAITSFESNGANVHDGYSVEGHWCQVARAAGVGQGYGKEEVRDGP